MLAAVIAPATAVVMLAAVASGRAPTRAPCRAAFESCCALRNIHPYSIAPKVRGNRMTATNANSIAATPRRAFDFFLIATGGLPLLIHRHQGRWPSRKA